jgi:prevent-host-death family protein
MFYNVTMERVGIRDLKQRASAVIRRVAAGEEIEVTDRGRPVARLVPIRQGDDYARLIADGEVSPGSGRWREHEPLPPLPGKSLSQALAELRDEDER